MVVYQTARRDPFDRQTKLTTELCKLEEAHTHHPLAFSDLDVFEQFLDVDILGIKASGRNMFIKTPLTGSQSYFVISIVMM